MSSTSNLTILRNLLLVAAVLLTIWTALWVTILVNRTALVWSEDAYRRGTLVVESTSLETIRHGTQTDGFDVAIWWAIGTVRLDPAEARGGALEYPGERLSLKPLIDEPANEAALAAAVPPGTTFDVWFHPGMPKVVSQDEWLRVVAYDPDFFDDARRLRNGIALRTVVPLGAILAAWALLTWTLRRRRRASTRATETAQRS